MGWVLVMVVVGFIKIVVLGLIVENLVLVTSIAVEELGKFSVVQNLIFLYGFLGYISKTTLYIESETLVLIITNMKQHY
jgi:hypothetical protein